ncbi:MAG: energy transducer TonB [Gammaproteobacteria bacterium]|nr:TonB family protein [Gammaproteobacteria bacterium]NNC97896.1 energy transducer TonB [Gammaproteobacteria bacterium]NNM13535.1 energy transducer TonB [Gammaproteobacteria bacterium]
MLNDNDRLMTAFFVAIILHGIVILGITFESEALIHSGSDQLEVVLIQGHSDDLEPENAKYYAQSNQLGSGNTADQVRASSDPTQGDPFDNPGNPDGQALQEREVITDEAMRQYLAARKSDRPSVLIQVKPDIAISDYRLKARLMTSGEQVLAPQEKTDVKNLITASEDNELVVSINAKESNVANYISAWRQKVERIGTLNYPKDLLEKNRQRSPVIEVSIGRDGSIRKAAILRTSGSGSTDQAALRILRLAAPFDPFPEELAVGNNALTFVYEWQFTEVGVVKGRAFKGDSN